MASFIHNFKKLDIYRKLPVDLTEPSYSGAFISIISLVFMALLFVSELANHMQMKTNSTMFVDSHHGD
jgi:hypothetical protein